MSDFFTLYEARDNQCFKEEHIRAAWKTLDPENTGRGSWVERMSLLLQMGGQDAITGVHLAAEEYHVTETEIIQRAMRNLLAGRKKFL